MNIGEVVFGGAVTLAGTLVVQLFVIPAVQARTRGQERWERDILELAAVIEEEFPRSLDT
ncbi:hypothetical protein OG799_19410 [Micromonospora sp. NBC_00898]|uniref:hypothetical protein n=1 Tax=Micromonospora sp. NBC_00898 TaxID=2975981 RepID=UPI00386AFBE3|nr:hypothetical protein OG799_19410 [Micromonospora sp. NBC_00898]